MHQFKMLFSQKEVCRILCQCIFTLNCVNSKLSNWCNIYENSIFHVQLFNFKFSAYLRTLGYASVQNWWMRPLYRHAKRFRTSWCTMYHFENLDINQQKKLWKKVRDKNRNLRTSWKPKTLTIMQEEMI